MFRISYSTTVLVVAITLGVSAQTPNNMTYQGRLTDAAGDPVADSAHSVVFTIYEDTLTGSALWAETLSVNTTDGLFSVTLGQVHPLVASIFTNPSVIGPALGIKVGTDPELSPRTVFTSMPYAFRANGADSAQFATDVGDNSIDSTEILPGGISFSDIGQNGASSGEVMKWNGSAWVTASDETGGGGSGWNWQDSSSYGPDSVSWAVFADSARTVDAGDINTGTLSDTRLSANVSLLGSSIESAEISNSTIGFIDIAQNGAVAGQVMKYNGGQWVASNDSVGSSSGWADDGTVVRLEMAGDSVGIGTASPSAKLDVVGDAVISGKATIGPGHANTGVNTFVAGQNNTAGDTAATIGGGSFNFARGVYSTIAGGGGASAADSNSALGDHTVIGGGSGNLAVGEYATIGGGRLNYSRGIYSTVGGGGGAWPTDSNSASGDYSTVGGGNANSAPGEAATVGGGAANTAGYAYNTIGGGQINSTTGFGGTVGGGQANTANQYATVSGGIANTASGLQSTIGGGRFNFARGDYSVVSGGGGVTDVDSNSAIGDYSAIPGGTRNIAAGKFSFAAGRRAQANHAGAFVWADSTDASFTSTAANQFLVRASGGVGIGTTSPLGGLHVASGKTYSGYFTSDSLSGSTNVVHAEYNGVSGNGDVIAVYGRSAPTDFYGIGGNFLGGYRGVIGGVLPTGNYHYLGVYGYVAGGTGTNYGVRGYAEGSGTNYAIYGSVGGVGTSYAGYFDGNVNVTGTLTKGGGAFKIDHPLDPENKYLYHSFVESPDMKNIYDGNITTDNDGYATVTLPNWFEALNRDFRYQLTVIGDFARAVISSEIQNNHFTIRTDKPSVKVSWQVTGIRKDKFAEAHRIPVEVDKPADERGMYLHPLEFGLDETNGIEYQREKEQRDSKKGNR